ncbi:MAG: hypothetical protein D0433_10545 [Candidatus Thermochlorobacter aerophilum]|uniref:Uncharacterized protein n=1 Tax=Candidatus Thermochlorobacter aerophilus TaxID=1868324 RepID=A0A395LYD9_9BACT|nr:MAG: hypothetical protein D0433_10545 [Candidatus Thermochlorobacter aerophilum]
MTRWRIANLTLWSLSFNKERDVLAKPKQGEVRMLGCELSVASIARNLTLSASQHCLSFKKEREWQTSPSGPSPSTRRGTFWRKPKQGEVMIGAA